MSLQRRIIEAADKLSVGQTQRSETLALVNAVTGRIAKKWGIVITRIGWRRGKKQRGGTGLQLGRSSRTTRPILLNRWARHRSIWTKYAAVSRFWFEPLATALAVIEELAGVSWHSLDRRMAAFRASYCRLLDHGRKSALADLV